MTLDEAIKDSETISEECQRVVDTGIVFSDVTIDMIYRDNAEEELAKYQLTAKNYRQLAEWLKDYKRLLEQTRWIPVDDRLPENDDDVLVCFPQGGIAVAYYHIDDTCYPTQYEDLDETGWFNEEGEAFYFEPIAWMPLPKSYEPQESEDQE